jgi:hypothetical protein
MPLTSVDQSSYDWHKHPHTKILLNARIRALKPDRKGMLWMLIEHAALEVPFGSVPNDSDRLAEMAGVSAKVWDKATQQVMGAGFVLCNDDRWYCPLLVDQLSPVADRRDDDQSVDAASKAAERARRYRENKKRDVDRDAQSSERDASVTHHTSERDANVTQRDGSVTIGGIKGGDLDLEKDLDLDKPTPLAPLPEFKEQVDRPEKTFEQSGIKNIPDHWVTLAKTQYPDLNKNQIDLIFAKMQTVYTSQTRFMGTKVRDWSTKWKEFVIRHAPSIIAQSNQFASTQPQATQQPEPEFVKPSAPVKRGPTPEQLAEQKRQAAEYLESRAGGAA